MQSQNNNKFSIFDSQLRAIYFKQYYNSIISKFSNENDRRDFTKGLAPLIFQFRATTEQVRELQKTYRETVESRYPELLRTVVPPQQSSSWTPPPLRQISVSLQTSSPPPAAAAATAAAAAATASSSLQFSPTSPTPSPPPVSPSPSSSSSSSSPSSSPPSPSTSKYSKFDSPIGENAFALDRKRKRESSPDEIFNCAKINPSSPPPEHSKKIHHPMPFYSSTSSSTSLTPPPPIEPIDLSSAPIDLSSRDEKRSVWFVPPASDSPILRSRLLSSTPPPSTSISRVSIDNHNVTNTVRSFYILNPNHRCDYWLNRMNGKSSAVNIPCYHPNCIEYVDKFLSFIRPRE